jgi:hypothetical protein
MSITNYGQWLTGLCNQLVICRMPQESFVCLLLIFFLHVGQFLDQTYLIPSYIKFLNWFWTDSR